MFCLLAFAMIYYRNKSISLMQLIYSISSLCVCARYRRLCAHSIVIHNLYLVYVEVSKYIWRITRPLSSITSVTFVETLLLLSDDPKQPGYTLWITSIYSRPPKILTQAIDIERSYGIQTNSYHAVATHYCCFRIVVLLPNQIIPYTTSRILTSVSKERVHELLWLTVLYIYICFIVMAGGGRRACAQTILIIFLLSVYHLLSTSDKRPLLLCHTWTGSTQPLYNILSWVNQQTVGSPA